MTQHGSAVLRTLRHQPKPRKICEMHKVNNPFRVASGNFPETSSTCPDVDLQ